MHANRSILTSLSAVLGAAMLLAACTGGSTLRTASRPSGQSSVAPDVVFLGTSQGPASADLATGDVVVADPAAVPGPDGSRLYSAASAGGSTIVRVLDPATGDVLASSTVSGDLSVRVASESGSSVALMPPRPTGVDAWTPVPRTRTTIVVADPNGVAAPRRYHLRGNYEPEAFSLDDAYLFLIHYLPAAHPQAYRVSELYLATGRTWRVPGRDKTTPPRMPGVRLRQVYAPDGRQLYTLYTNEPSGSTGYGAYGGSSDWGNGTSGVTFVHVLNLQDGWAYCADLPRGLWDEPAGSEALAVSPDGHTLYIVDAARGLVAAMNTRTLRVPQMVHVDLGAAADGRISAQVSADGRTLFVGGGGNGGGAIAAIDVTTLALRDRWAMPLGVSGLGLSGDGADLVVALGDRLLTIDPGTGRTLTTVALAGLGSILRVGTPGV